MDSGRRSTGEDRRAGPAVVRQTSGWHSHPGLHLVTVVSGTLTVYGPDCQPRSYGPGELHIGGDTVHLARTRVKCPSRSESPI
jgi:hypothetical protein